MEYEDYPEGYLTTWNKVDESIRKVCAEFPNWWVFSVEWREYCYEVKLTKGPGMAWVSYKSTDLSFTRKMIQEQEARS